MSISNLTPYRWPIIEGIRRQKVMILHRKDKSKISNVFSFEASFWKKWLKVCEVLVHLSIISTFKTNFLDRPASSNRNFIPQFRFIFEKGLISFMTVRYLNLRRRILTRILEHNKFKIHYKILFNESYKQTSIAGQTEQRIPRPKVSTVFHQ